MASAAIDSFEMLDDLVSIRQPPANRVGFHTGDAEHHLTEGAVMVAFVLHLFRTVPDLKQVCIHPDGEHGKIFDFMGWLGKQGFGKMSSMGTTSYGGLYADPQGRTILLNPKSGRQDVVATIGDSSYVAEAKGGVINTRHSGKTSQLRKGLCEAVGMLMQTPLVAGQRQFAVVPLTQVTEKLAGKMLARTKAAGIEVALVDGRGNVLDVT